MKYSRHGLSETRLHRIWRRMRYRCLAETCDHYKDYGARGISICPEWEDFNNFYQRAINSGYDDNLSIDRIDVNGDYCPENCRWATSLVQMNNRRSNHFITYQGETKTLAQWAETAGMKWHTLFKRLSRGMSFEEAIIRPVERRKT